MTIVFLTKKNLFGNEIICQLKLNNVDVKCILIEKPESSYYKQRMKSVFRRNGFIGLAEVLIDKFKRKMFADGKELWRRDSYYTQFSSRVEFVNNFNSLECQAILEFMAPDIIILGGARIIKSNIIRIPSIGILNAHPGKLPEYRGINVIPWAIHNDDEVGVTVHFVDEGVDTGRVFAFRKIEITGDLNSLEKIRIAASKIAGNLMTEVVQRIIKEGGQVQTLENTKAMGKQYYRMPQSLYKKTEKKLKQRLLNGGNQN